jgi:hypothetical protein
MKYKIIIEFNNASKRAQKSIQNRTNQEGKEEIPHLRGESGEEFENLSRDNLQI